MLWYTISVHDLQIARIKESQLLEALCLVARISHLQVNESMFENFNHTDGSVTVRSAKDMFKKVCQDGRATGWLGNVLITINQK